VEWTQECGLCLPPPTHTHTLSAPVSSQTQPQSAGVYGGTFDLVHKDLRDLGITVTTLDISQPAESWAPLVRPNTKVSRG
jgi:cystathionine beta-lyase/cystathionine gamma-synthase